MDLELAEAILQERRDAEEAARAAGEPIPEPERAPLSPLGFSQQVYLQLATVEAIRNLNHTLGAVYGSKAAPPPQLPRPKTALEIAERDMDRREVDFHLSKLGLNN